MSFSRYPNSSSTSTWGYPVYLCNCCPYGYHIDLDFVQYCESISKESDRTGSIKRRKDRRRQRKSMEVLLGLDTIEQHYAKPLDPISPIIECENRHLQKQDSFDNVIDDFEKTFQRSKNQLSNNLPDVTAVTDIRRTPHQIAASEPTITGHLAINKKVQFDKDYDNNQTNNLSPTTFKNIREQMALSLERTRQLEEQMKQLPELKVQISALQDENTRLKQKLEDKTNLVDNLIGLSTKDIGVTCSVLTRNVSVGPKVPSRKNVSTLTNFEDKFADKWYGEKLKFINDQYEKESEYKTCNKGNQTKSTNTNTQTTQTIEIQQKKLFNDKEIQTLTNVTATKNKNVLVKPQTNDFNVQKSVQVYNIGVSDDTITDINCDKCNVARISVAVGADKNEDSHVSPISLASLSFPRSKSFNFGEDKLDLSVRKKSISVQYQYKPECSSKSTQHEPSTMSRSTQSNIIQTHSKGSQFEIIKLVDNFTQSEVLKKKDVACGTVVEEKPKLFSVSTNTAPDYNTFCVKCRNIRTLDDLKKKDEPISTPVVGISKIPRLSLTPTLERRKFRRQDTYTKINASPPPEEQERLSGLDLSKATTSTTTSTFEKVRENLKIETPIAQVETRATPATVTKHRKKAIPSKEMQGAMKVLNDSLHQQSKHPKNHRAIDIIQQEWFKISGLVTANPLDVEDYLDAFEDMSSLLLDYIVNMTDASGNTAMHYAVSHGNFDVVSILLDSKVCDINKPNKAGYTSVMLVSLADIRSQTHANVVRRLFQMADVNIRAKQHGQTALMLAVSHGRLDMVKMLLEAGADINIQDDDGSTALMCAAEHGHIEIVKHFLSHPDCDSTITDVDGSTALKIAMEAEHRPIGVLLYAHERNLMGTHKHKKKASASSSPKPPSSPHSMRHHSALNEKSSK